jgi:NADPH-dependent glutamate synthase beta subunit-like oxidoreductase
MREYTDEECITPCQRACPTGIDIKEYIRLIREGDYEGSVQVSKERNPFPTVISRICPAPCEVKCRRVLQDESVAINHLKRFVCDYEMNQNKHILPYKAPSTGKRVAIIGGGVEGLSAAYFSARLGHDPTVFEATDSLGGILRKAISRERLPMAVLDWDIEGVKKMGVSVQAHVTAGNDFTIDGLLKQGFHAVFTATGGWDSRLARGDIDTVPTIFPGAYLLIDLLRSKSDKTIRIPSGKNVVIAGDGIRVLDAVSILNKNGSKNITIVSRRHPEASSFDPTLIDTLSRAGARVIYNAGVTKIIGEEGYLKIIEYVELDTGVKHVIDTDTLIIGAGRFPELVFVPVSKDEGDGKQAGVLNNGALVWEGVELQKKPDSNRELGLLSKQDVTSEYASAVASINGGRKAAVAIHNLMHGIPFQEPYKFITEQSVLQDVASLINVDILPRNIIQLAPVKKGLMDDFPTGFSKEQAHAEASRCLRCGLVCYERSKDVG